MRNLQAFIFVRIGTQFCNEKLLPLIISYIEPKEDPALRHPLFTDKQEEKSHNLPEPNTVVTFYESQEIAAKYQTIFISIIYLAVCLAGVIVYFISSVVKAITYNVTLQEDLVFAISTLILLLLVTFWYGILISITNRKKIWDKAKEENIDIQKLEYFARGTSSKVIANILFEIEKLRSAQKEEAKRVIQIKKKRSILDAETMKMFNEMMNEREKELEKKGNIKAVGAWFLGVVVGYGIERILDYWLFGTIPTFGSVKKS